MIKSFMLAEPLLRPLVLVIKALVNAYDISDPYKGGLSSYAITLMVIALLQVWDGVMLVYGEIEEEDRECGGTVVEFSVFLWLAD